MTEIKLHQKIKTCWGFAIKVYPVPIEKGNNPKCKIEIDYQGTKRQGTQVYKQDRVLHNKINEIYEAYYYKLINS
jgi:hypothetical protein